MLMPGQLFDSSGRIKTTNNIGGATPASVNQGIALDASGRVLTDTGAPSGASYNAGFRLNPANGNLYITATPAGSDNFSSGYRFSNSGQLVVGVETVPTLFADGEGYGSSGELCVTQV